MKSVVILVLISFSFLYGQDNKRSLHELTSFKTDNNQSDYMRVKHTYLPDSLKKKNVLLGAGLSVLLPGAGEFYAQSYIKAAIFLGVEIASWGAHFYFNHKGNTQTDKFQSYADTYWDVRKYARWLVNEGFPEHTGINPDEPDLNRLREEIMVCESANFSHTMPEYHSQQFYELIGKYQNFQAGWINLAHDPTKTPGPYYYQTYKDPVFLDYSVERQKANDYYDYATTGIIVVIVNHVLSAADAAWSVSIFNKKLSMQTGFEIKHYTSPFTYQSTNMPTFNFKMSF